MHLYFSSLYFIVIRENRMSSKYVACLEKAGREIWQSHLPDGQASHF